MDALSGHQYLLEEKACYWRWNKLCRLVAGVCAAVQGIR